jgi:hypothetical protein
MSPGAKGVKGLMLHEHEMKLGLHQVLPLSILGNLLHPPFALCQDYGNRGRGRAAPGAACLDSTTRGERSTTCSEMSLASDCDTKRARFWRLS